MSGTLDGKQLLAFQAISAFVVEANTVGGKIQRSLQLYARLIEKTNFSHQEAIKKHLTAFQEFCKENREALMCKDATKLNRTVVEYSSRVFINIRLLFKNTDIEDQETIWEHLMTISAIVDPGGDMKKVLKAKSEDKAEKSSLGRLTSEGEENSAEDDFINNIMSRVENSVDPNSTDPSAALGQMMSGGVMTDLMKTMTSGMQDGDLDLGRLMGSLQKNGGKIRRHRWSSTRIETDDW